MALTCDGNISTVPTAGQDVNNICTIQHNIIPLKRWKTEFWDFYHTRSPRNNVRLWDLSMDPNSGCDLPSSGHFSLVKLADFEILLVEFWVAAVRQWAWSPSYKQTGIICRLKITAFYSNLSQSTNFMNVLSRKSHFHPWSSHSHTVKFYLKINSRRMNIWQTMALDQIFWTLNFPTKEIKGKRIFN